ncbi:TorD/DmsD family molecular chaperone [Ramlibacter algicola]|uniref:Molecular chaperone TorD family protein n=1 Tax=Ramlibacter algicola TaxID=2795217 RepID=A0A934Q033_9BURK|nr:molecular chaperone TorD family protein [Ramlibacter algicola]MBK0392016.1 molecular chaperone TorD family protein [Ramlibacter algicola]
MLADPGLQDTSDEDAARSSIYGLLARLLLRPQQVPLGWLASVDVGGDAHDPLSLTWSGLVAASRAGPQALHDAHAALFIAPGTPAINPYASWYRDGALMNTSLADLRSDLRELGLQRAKDARETEDHLGALCETMQQLILRGEPVETQAQFLRAHVLPWASRCLADIAEHPRAGLYAAAAAFATAFLASEDEALVQGETTA